MATIVLVGTQEFEIPNQGDNPDYGEQLTDFFIAVADALQTVQQPNDILRTLAPINNNVSIPTNVPGFSFDTVEVRSINSEYIITRTTDSPMNNLVESGFIQGNYDGTNWFIVNQAVGNAGVVFDITPSGQITYTSTNLVGSNYVGQILFRAKVFNEDE